jgi:hypothetical protein
LPARSFRSWRAALIERREVKFVIEHALTVLRTQVLRLPFLIWTELQEFDHNQRHAIRLRVEKEVDGALKSMAETLVQAINAADAFAQLADEGVVADEDARARKQAAINTKRREKYAAPGQGSHEHADTLRAAQERRRVIE